MSRPPLVIALIAGLAAAQATRPAGEARVIAMDHLESKGVTAWIIVTPAGDRDLVVARLGTGMTTRMRDVRLVDVLLDPGGGGAFLLLEAPWAVAYASLTSAEEPRVVASDLVPADPALQRAGEEVFVLTADAVVAVRKSGEPRVLLSRDDATVTSVLRNAAGTVLATVHGGSVEVVGPEGELVGSLGEGRSPAFVDDGTLAFARSSAERAGRTQVSEIVIADVTTGEIRPAPAILVEGHLTHLRHAGEGCVAFAHVPEKGERRFWLLHLESGVARPMDPADRGALRGAAPASRPAVDVGSGPIARLGAVPEPELESSGFFLDETGTQEVRTEYEASGWDDARNPDEAALYRKLLARFLEGVQCPLRRPAAYEPFFAPDDEPYRTTSSVPHLGLDVGSRLMHISTGSVAFHVAGTPVYPVYRGGRVWFDRTLPVRDLEPGHAGARFRILQEIELREGAYVLRIHVAYSHVKPRTIETPDGGVAPGPFTVSGDESIGTLEPYSADSPAGGWQTSAPELLAAGIAKGNHVHLGTGGIHRSFNAAPDGGQRKLRWYREALIPALRRAPAPR
jgi:hypothetical protein